MSEDKKSSFIVNNSKVSISGITVGLEGLSSLIKDNTIRQICSILSPALGWLIYLAFIAIIKYLSSRNGIKIYKSLIEDYKKDLLSPDLTNDEKSEIKRQIVICKDHIVKIKLQNIETRV